jgi:hypothetical protein
MSSLIWGARALAEMTIWKFETAQAFRVQPYKVEAASSRFGLSHAAGSRVYFAEASGVLALQKADFL